MINALQVCLCAKVIAERYTWILNATKISLFCIYGCKNDLKDLVPFWKHVFLSIEQIPLGLYFDRLMSQGHNNLLIES